MKNLIFLIAFSATLSGILFSCTKNSYAEDLRVEKALIEDYIKRNGIRVQEGKMPSNEDFLNDPLLYVKTTSGLYYRLDKEGIGEDSVRIGDQIIARYYEYTLNVKSDTNDYWSTTAYPYPYTFILGSMNQEKVSAAFQEAVAYMQLTGSESKLIVPSKLGFSEGTVVVPYGYKLKIQFSNDSIPKNNTIQTERF